MIKSNNFIEFYNSNIEVKSVKINGIRTKSKGN